MTTIIIGLGNPVLTDDSVGLKISSALREHLAGRTGVAIVELYSGGLQLVEAMAGFDRAIIVDAMVSGRPPGTIHELGPAEFPKTRSAYSSHDGSLPAAVEMGRMVGLRLPHRIAIWAVEAGDVETFGESLTPAVAPAVPQVVGRILEYLRSTPGGVSE
jgi:hydrogenase maturation protease